MQKAEIKGKINVLTGIHIGGSGDTNNIGGIDKPVIKTLRGDRYEPYIPGSSLRGKIRSLLEQKEGAVLGGDEAVNALFGYSADEIKSKLVVYDSYLTDESEEQLRNSEYLDMPYTEEKVENSIDRVKGQSTGGLRSIERVPGGATFDMRMILTCDDNHDFKKQFELLKRGMWILEKDYLGGNGSRGYGMVKFQDLKYTLYDLSALENYDTPTENELFQLGNQES